jgi:glutamate synthase (NADPH/NADH) small chain
MCGCCRASIAGETKFVCVDGPEFDGHAVDFPELMLRQKMYNREERRALWDHKCKIDAQEKAIKKARKRVKMPEQAPKQRIQNFAEVALGYTKENAMREAQRCLGCKKPPCVEGCPVNVQIPQFIAKIKEGDFMSAIHIIKETNSLPAVCGGSVQGSQCVSKCILGKMSEPVAFAASNALRGYVLVSAMSAFPRCEERAKGRTSRSQVRRPHRAGELSKKGHSAPSTKHFKGGRCARLRHPRVQSPKAIVQRRSTTSETRRQGQG